MVSMNKSLNKVGSYEPLKNTFNLQKIAPTNFNSLLPQLTDLHTGKQKH